MHRSNHAQRKTRGLALILVLLMTVSAFAVIAPPTATSAQDGSRATVSEVEPNDDYAEAQLINAGDFINGYLHWDVDRNDVFKVSASANQILNVSFVQHEYNPMNTSEFNIEIEVLGPLPAHALIRRETKKTVVDSVSAFCIEDGEYFIWVYLNPSSRPVNYTLNAEVTNLTAVGEGQYNGHLDATNTPQGTNPYNWYKLSIPPETGIQVTLDVPDKADFDVFAFIQWDRLDYFYPGHKNPLWLNASTDNATGNFEFLKATAWDGTYYLKLKAWPGSKGDYSLTLTEITPMDNDHDNIPGEAEEVEEKGTTKGRLQQAHDHFDWYKVLLDEGDTINVTMTLLTNTGMVYNMTVYDKNLDYLTGVFNTHTGNYYNSTNPVDGQCDLVNFTATSTGYYYFMVMPVRDPSWWGQKQYTPVESEYEIEWDLPNLGPENNLTIQDIEFDEDEVYTGLDLDEHFMDPESNPLTYSQVGTVDNLTVAVDEVEGTVVMTPAPNWNTGDDFVSVEFEAEDPISNTGSPTATATARVRVVPVNDGPETLGTFTDVAIDEDQEKLLPDNLYHIFGDIDDETLEFTAGENGSVPLDMDNVTGEIVVGPVTGWFGTKDINITAIDSASQEAHAELTVIVSHVNHDPVVSDGLEERTLEIEEDSAETPVFVVPWFEDPDLSYTSDSLVYTVGSPMPENLLATMEDGFLSITPLSDWNGEETVWVEATDDSGAKARIKLLVTVLPVNDAPEIVSTDPLDHNISVNEGTGVNLSVTEVRDMETNITQLGYSWYLNDVELQATGPEITVETDFDPTTSTISAGTHHVRVMVDDSELNDTFEWNLTVVQVNRGPENIVILRPENGTVFKHNEEVVLEAGNATDMDGDQLSYTWRNVDTGEVLGQNRTLDLGKLKKGDYTISLEVSDGKGGDVTEKVQFKVKGKKQSEPGFLALGLVGAMLLAAVLVSRRRSSS